MPLVDAVKALHPGPTVQQTYLFPTLQPGPIIDKRQPDLVKRFEGATSQQTYVFSHTFEQPGPLAPVLQVEPVKAIHQGAVVQQTYIFRHDLEQPGPLKPVLQIEVVKALHQGATVQGTFLFPLGQPLPFRPTSQPELAKFIHQDARDTLLYPTQQPLPFRRGAHVEINRAFHEEMAAGEQTYIFRHDLDQPSPLRPVLQIEAVKALHQGATIQQTYAFRHDTEQPGPIFDRTINWRPWIDSTTAALFPGIKETTAVLLQPGAMTCTPLQPTAMTCTALQPGSLTCMEII